MDDDADDDTDCGWTGRPAERSPDRPPFRCKCGLWTWWRLRDAGQPWQCLACDPNPYELDLSRVEFASTLRPEDAAPTPR
jgi:hypothetical protein